VQAVLGGATLKSDSHASMPSFGDAYSDVEVAAVANYVTARFGSSPSSVTAANVADMRRQVGK
ncbi:MAG TPA: cytochrome c, partial [Steroidobacteraceae bacterium]|nr:cytochrome c [Steroidobacteraceae bacterium]